MNSIAIEKTIVTIAVLATDSYQAAKKELQQIDYRELAEQAAYTGFSIAITLAHLYVALGIDIYRLAKSIYNGLQKPKSLLPAAPDRLMLPPATERPLITLEVTATPVSRVLVTPAPEQPSNRVILVPGKQATVTELRKIAKPLGIQGLSKLKKDALLDLLFGQPQSTIVNGVRVNSERYYELTVARA